MAYQPVTSAEFKTKTSPRPGVTLVYQIILWYCASLGFTGGGIYNRRPRRGLAVLTWKTASLHAVGRACDIMIPAAMKHFGDILFVKLVAAAPLIGIGEIIWYRQRWTAEHGVQPYKGTNPHTDHIHAGFTVDWADSAYNDPAGDYKRWVTAALGWA